MPDDQDRGDAPPPAPTKTPKGGGAAAAPAKPVTSSTPAQRWLTPNELEALRGRLKKRFH